MIRISSLLGGLLVAVLMTGCLNPASARNARRYRETGMAAEKAGDLRLAKKYYARAFANADIGFLSVAPKAYAHYDYSRVTGYLGNHREAALGFSNVLSWIELAAPKADDLRAPALSEYARLLHDTGQHRKALPFFESAVLEFDRRNKTATDPIGLAEFLDDYATSLQASGRSGEAIAERARSLREANKGAVAKFKTRRYSTRSNDPAITR